MLTRDKNRYFYHIFVSPEDAPGAITLNVVWMDREYDAYKLSRCMCPFNYYRFWDRARYLWKNVILSYPLHLTPPLGRFTSEYCHPVWYGKTRMVGLPDGEKSFEDMCNRLGTIPACDRQTDRRTDILPRHSPRYACASCGKKVRDFLPTTRCISQLIQGSAICNANRNSCAIYQMVPFPMTLNKF